VDVALYMLARGHRGERAREALGMHLGGGDDRVGQVDESGAFKVKVDAGDRADGLNQVWNAIAAAGVDDQIAFMEHPCVSEHWRHGAGRPLV
jgi:hypothetical protein